MAKAVGVGTKELFKMMEQGQLVSSEVLPKFAKQLKIAVREGDALGEGLKTSRVAMQRFGTSFKLNILDSFDAGLESGMSDFFNNLTAIVKNMAPGARVLGAALGGLLKIVSVLGRAFYQLVRPISLFLDANLNSEIKDANKQLSTMDRLVGYLGDTFRNLAGVIIAPFALLEIAMDRFEKRKNTLTTTGEYDTASLAGSMFSRKGMIHGPVGMMNTIARDYFKTNNTNNETKNEVNIKIEAGVDDSWIGKFKSVMSDVLGNEYTTNVVTGD